MKKMKINKFKKIMQIKMKLNLKMIKKMIELYIFF